MNATATQALQLRDIHLPAPPGWWPPAPGWWVLAALLLALAAWATMILYRQARLRRRRQRLYAAISELEHRLHTTPEPVLLARISELLKRLALAQYPRDRVAALHGQAWLEFLDRTGGNGRFAHGPARVLGDGAYRRSLPVALDSLALGVTVRDWIAKNTGTVR